MSAPLIIETDPLTTLEGICCVLKVHEPDALDPCLLDAFSFKTPTPGKWPAWTDLEIGRGNPANRNEVVRAIQDLCSKIDQVLARPAYQKSLGAEAADLHRSRMAGVRKKLALLEDLLSSPDLGPMLAALEETKARFSNCDLAHVDPKILDSFPFRSGKPGLFAAWTDLDLGAGKIGWPSQRREVVAALRDLLSKAEQALARPACQRALGPEGLEKYRLMLLAIEERAALLGDALSPPNPKPLLSALEEADRKLGAAPTVDALDSFAFFPGRPGLFAAWTDLDLSSCGSANGDNRGAVVMALDDLLAKFDHMAARPGYQKAIGAVDGERYRLMRQSLENRMKGLKDALSPALPSTCDRTDVQTRKTFSRAAWIEAGAAAGMAMVAAFVLSFAFHPLARAVPLIGFLAVAYTFVRLAHKNPVALDL